MNVTDTALSLLYQFYGLSFFLLGLSAYIIPGRNLNFSVFRHARWLSAFGILHGFVGFLAGEANRNPGILLSWFLIFFVGTSFMCMLEFSRRIWNDCSFGKHLPIHPIFIALLLLPQIYIFFAVENVTGGLDIGFRLLIGTPAMIIAGIAIFSDSSEESPEHRLAHLMPLLKVMAIAFILFGLLTPFSPIPVTEFNWIPSTSFFNETFSMPVQLPRTICAAIITLMMVDLARKSSRIIEQDALIRAQLEADEAQFRELFEMTPSAIISMDKMTIVDCNKAALDMFRLKDKSELIGKSPLHISPEFQPAGQLSEELAQEFANRTYRTGHTEFDWNHRRKTGEVFPSRISLTLMNTPTRPVLQGIISDMTEQKKAETEVVRYREHLEELVKDRTQELNQALKEARKANEAKSVFLSTMSHELRTPLNAILGFSQLLQHQDNTARHTEDDQYLQEILDAGNHLLSLVNDLLDLSRIESGTIEMNFVDIRLGPLVIACRSQLQSLAEQRQIQIETVCDENLKVFTDETRLKQVLLNLLSNAIKYNRNGGKVSITACADSDYEVRIEITDTGHGIAQDNLEKVFRPFERIRSSHEEIEGTGIGLALSKNIVSALQGHIGVISEPGRGSTFWVRIPRNKPAGT